MIMHSWMSEASFARVLIVSLVMNHDQDIHLLINY